MKKWLGEKDVTDGLSQSLSNNVTTEMGLALLDVADVVRRYPAVMEYFHHASDETFFEDLAKLRKAAKKPAIPCGSTWRNMAMRCPGEIDITRTRWAEKPTMLIPMILNNIKNFEPGSHTNYL